jgi:hypothetical protein
MLQERRDSSSVQTADVAVWHQPLQSQSVLVNLQLSHIVAKLKETVAQFGLVLAAS